MRDQSSQSTGPGLLESAYQISLEEEFTLSNSRFKAQVAVPLIYNGRRTKKGYRIDFLVEESVVVEVKAERRIQLLDFAQLQTYLKLLNLRIGLILNFNTQWMKNGIARIVNPAFLL